MRTSKASSYAVHALMYMVRHSTLLPITNKIIAKSEGIPEGYLAKIFQRLAKAGIVVSCKTGKGGYSFARPPEKISVTEVLDTIEGESVLEDCFMRYCECKGTPETCDIYRMWVEATAKLREFLEQKSLADIAWHHPEHYFKNRGMTTPVEAGETEGCAAKADTESM